MRLRDHPALYNKKFTTWPPPWSTTRKDETDIPAGEVGVLKDARVTELAENIIFLRMEYRGKLYMGCLMVTDTVFFRHLYLVLKGLIGRSIEEIGDFDLSFTL